eukprot:scaffold159671_cov34-Tisochrysis_lutea.AAC.6
MAHMAGLVSAHGYYALCETGHWRQRSKKRKTADRQYGSLRDLLHEEAKLWGHRMAGDGTRQGMPSGAARLLGYGALTWACCSSDSLQRIERARGDRACKRRSLPQLASCNA